MCVLLYPKRNEGNHPKPDIMDISVTQIPEPFPLTAGSEVANEGAANE